VLPQQLARCITRLAAARAPAAGLLAGAADLSGQQRLCLQVGNGDVLTPADAQQLLAETACDGIMVGRGAIQDPLVFHRIRAVLRQPAGAPAAGWEGGAQGRLQLQTAGTSQPGSQAAMAASTPSPSSPSTSTAASAAAASPLWPGADAAAAAAEAQPACMADEAAAVQAFLRLYAGSGFVRSGAGAPEMVRARPHSLHAWPPQLVPACRQGAATHPPAFPHACRPARHRAL